VQRGDHRCAEGRPPLCRGDCYTPDDGRECYTPDDGRVLHPESRKEYTQHENREEYTQHENREDYAHRCASYTGRTMRIVVPHTQEETMRIVVSLTYGRRLSASLCL